MTPFEVAVLALLVLFCILTDHRAESKVLFITQIVLVIIVMVSLGIILSQTLQNLGV